MRSGALFAVAFYVVAAATLAAGVGVVVLRNVVHAALALIATFFFVSWLYLLLSADLLWVAQLLIYAGAIPVLVVFAIMFTRRSMSDTSNADTGNRSLAAFVAGGVFALLLVVLNFTTWFSGDWPGFAGTTIPLGTQLIRVYVVPFEVVSVLLLIGLIGAVILARRPDDQ